MKYKLIIDENAEEEIIAIVRAPSALTDKIESLIRSSGEKAALVGYREDEMRRLDFQEIECISVIDRRVIAIDSRGEQYRLHERLKELEEILPESFVRINKSAIANTQRIERFDTVFSGGVDAVFRCGWRDYVSRRCFGEIRRRFEGK